MSGKVVLFGAGGAGRGHVGLQMWQAGYELVLVDKKPDLVSMLQEAGSYTVRLYGGKDNPGGNPYREVQVSGYRVYFYLEREAIAAEIIDADLVLTAVFEQNLSDVAQTLALGVAACRKSGRTAPLNCIACENMMHSSSILSGHVRGLLAGGDLEYYERVFAFPDSMISRVVPRPEPDSLRIITEDYYEWTVSQETFKGSLASNLNTFELVPNQSARLERKLFIHNGGHAVCGYFGFHYGHRFIHEALADRRVLRQVNGALDELGEVVRRKYGFSVESIQGYKEELGVRGGVAELRDEVLRVVRDPLRKLSVHERLVAPALLAVEYGLRRGWIVQGIVAALKYCHPQDAQSLELADRLAQGGLLRVLQEVCGIPPASPVYAEILAAWDEWELDLA